MKLSIGTIIADRYEITQKLGQGGMAIVYKAYDRTLSRDVSLKVLREEYSLDEDFRKRFHREARSVASLSHQNIVNVFDVVRDNGVNAIVMEFIDGKTLKDLIVARGAFAPREAVGVAYQMASALIHAHDNNIVHRDIKPHNVMITTKGAVRGAVKVADFGIARKVDSSSHTLDSSTTMGSVHYFSPEQAEGGKTDPRSDLYSLGIVMFEMFSGELPFEADTSVAVALKQIQEPLPDIKEFNPNVSTHVRAIIDKLTEKNPDDRYQNARELYAELKSLLERPALLFDEDTGPVPATAARTSILPEGFVVEDGDFPDEYNESDEYGEYYEDDTQDQYQEQYQDPPAPKATRGRPAPPTEPPIKRNKRVNITEKKPKASVYDSATQSQATASKDRVIYFAAAATALVLIILALIFIVRPLLIDFFNPSQSEVTIPYGFEIEGRDLTALQENFGRGTPFNLNFVEEPREYHPHLPVGAVITQLFGDLSGLEPGNTVRVVVSQGQRYELVPDFVGRTYTEALALAEGLFNLVEIPMHNELERETVFEQYPEANSSQLVGSTVRIYVSQGAGIETVTVPTFLGMTEADARAVAEDLGIRISITSTFHDNEQVGTVFFQSLNPGSDIVRTRIVTLTVSTGPRPDQGLPNGNGSADGQPPPLPDQTPDPNQPTPPPTTN
ncbi:MAG: Stk1 family PASTA domain-containing Ser/Thr kinase, partial [Defluviitaleaceae bacterium]|nr:Stk1 family PASTA domain-containing Ser/Thr kinase [Defluviitaleaceae bacterium]